MLESTLADGESVAVHRFAELDADVQILHLESKVGGTALDKFDL